MILVGVLVSISCFSLISSWICWICLTENVLNDRHRLKGHRHRLAWGPTWLQFDLLTLRSEFALVRRAWTVQKSLPSQLLGLVEVVVDSSFRFSFGS